MRKLTLMILVFALLPILSLQAQPSADVEKQWPQWRGPQMNGIASNSNPPAEWSETKNVKWKVEIPGMGHATPVIWGNQIFVQTAIEEGATQAQNNQGEGGRRGRRRGIQPSGNVKFTIMAINRNDGKVLWQHTSREEVPHQGTHNTGSWASNSGATDGQYVWAYYGSRGLFCYDMKGNLKWQKDFGEMEKRRGFGEGSSPALYGDKLIINWDHEGQSFIVALDKATGKELWRTNRDEETSWSTPFVVEHGGGAQVIVNARNRIRSYNLDTGKLIWECGGMTQNPIPTPVYADGMLYVTTGFRSSILLAIDLSAAKGDITDTKAVVWRHSRDTPYTPSPLYHDGHIYFLKVNSEILTCLNAKTGETVYDQKRLDGLRGVYASPVLAGNRIYIAGRNGTTAVLKPGSNFEVLAMNTLDDNFDASPAVVGDEIYLRGHNYLYRISK